MALDREDGRPPYYASWQEIPVRLTRGNRLLHFVLHTVDGAAVLAAVGVERSVRHMIFTIPETFRYPIGAKKVPKSKYRTRRELEGWLESLILLTPPSKRRRLTAKDEYEAGCLSVQNASLLIKDEPANETDCATYCSSSPEESSLKVSEDVALWSFVEATCNGRTRIAFFKRLIYEKDLNPRASLQWFENPRDLKAHYGVEVADAHEHELFFTSTSDTVPIDAVKRVVTVLSQAHFAKRAASLLSREKSSCFMCYRKVDGGKIRRVRIESFQGYYSQGILVQACCDEAAEVLESRNGKVGQRLTKPRTQRVPKHKLLACLNSPEVKCSSMQSFNLSDSDMDADEADGRVEDEGQNQPGELAMTEKKEIWDASVGSMVEVLNDDVSRLCWRPAEVVFSRLLEVKVRYFTPRSISGEDKEEWVLLRQLGGADKYGFRYSHRNCVRPYQLHDCDGAFFEDGELVDVRWCDRWWEAIAVHSWTNGFVAVHLLGPGDIKFVHKKFLRRSREWVRGHWEAVNPQKHFANNAASMHVDPELRNLSKLPPKAIAGPDTLNQNGVSSTLGFLKYLREIVWEALQREESCDSEQVHGVDLGVNEVSEHAEPISVLASQEKLIPESTSRVGDVITKQMWEEYSSCTPEGSLSSDLATHHKTPTEATVRNLCQESQLKPSTCRDSNLVQEGKITLDMLSDCSEDSLQHNQDMVTLEVSSSQDFSDPIGCARPRIGCASSILLQQNSTLAGRPLSPNWLQIGLSTILESPPPRPQPQHHSGSQPQVDSEADINRFSLPKVEPGFLALDSCMPAGPCYQPPCATEFSDCSTQPRPPSSSPPETPPPPPYPPPASPLEDIARPDLQLL